MPEYKTRDCSCTYCTCTKKVSYPASQYYRDSEPIFCAYCTQWHRGKSRSDYAPPQSTTYGGRQTQTQSAQPTSNPSYHTAAVEHFEVRKEEEDSIAKGLLILLGVGILFLLFTLALFVAAVRFSIYAAGLMWIPIVIACSPLWLRILMEPETLSRHTRLAWTALWSSPAPLVAYAAASYFEMLPNSFPLSPYSLGTMLVASSAICAATAMSAIAASFLQARLNQKYSSAVWGDGTGTFSLFLQTNSRRYLNYSLDILLVLIAVIGCFAGGTAFPLGIALAMMVLYTWFWRSVHDVMREIRDDLKQLFAVVRSWM